MLVMATMKQELGEEHLNSLAIQPHLHTALRNTAKWGNPFISDRIIVWQRTVFPHPIVHYPLLGHQCDLCHVG